MKKTIYTLIAPLLICTSSFAQWQQANGPYGGDILCLMNMGPTIYAGTEYGVYKSTNSGMSWTSNGLPDTYIYSIDTCLGNIYVGTDKGVYKSSFSGGTWTAMNNGLTNLDVLSIAVTPTNKIFAGTWGDGVFISSNFGATWVASNSGMTSTDIMSLAISSQGFVFAGTETGVFGSGFNGTAWTEYNMGYMMGINALAIDGQGNIYAGAYCCGVYRSTDHGITWTDFNMGLLNTEVQAVAIGGDGYIYAGTKNSGVYVCKNIFNGWTTYNGGITDNTSVTAFAKDGSTAFTYMGTTRGVFHGNTLGWTEKNIGLNNTDGRSMAVNSAGAFLAGTAGQGVFNYEYNSSSGTYNWVPLRAFSFFEDNIRNVNALALGDTGFIQGVPIPLFAYAGTFDGTDNNLFVASHNGINSWNSWVNSYTGLTGFDDVRALEVATGTGTVYAGTFGGGAFRSINNGVSWNSINNGLPPDIISFSKVYSTGPIFAGTYGNGVYLSNDQGSTWVSSGLTTNTVTSICRSGSDLYAGTTSGIFLSVDDGGSWLSRNTGLGSLNVRAIATSGTKIFAATSAGVYLSTNNGLQWNAVNTGLSNTNIWSMVIRSSEIFAGTLGSGVWRRSLSEMVIGIEEYGDNASFNIYPNPSSGIFKFDIDKNATSKINLKIYNLLGEMVYSESYGNQKTSNEIDLSSSPKGIYFVKIYDAEHVYSKKILVQ